MIKPINVLAKNISVKKSKDYQVSIALYGGEHSETLGLYLNLALGVPTVATDLRIYSSTF